MLLAAKVVKINHEKVTEVEWSHSVADTVFQGQECKQRYQKQWNCGFIGNNNLL